ncbi:Discoidin domain-containing receptor tyrosine kinase B [Frankliniella fusca]|uniref:Discoidin domain-containing receptor tyrosine kinase B n=1 Tax=Frankliniella fusca TaxID=407009 RepID=A0AAE1LCB2_9NEOP|nr:Discoidin domain-containing receptor tyrosine kinase B [Frankliniella fusca]
MSIRTEGHGGAWCPQHQATADPSEWLQVELHTVHVITAVETQGRFGNGQGQEYAEAFILEYWRPSLDKWVRYRDQEGEEFCTKNWTECSAVASAELKSSALTSAELKSSALVTAEQKSSALITAEL